MEDIPMTDATRPDPPLPRTSFLSLPREIRDSIYHLALHRTTTLRPVGPITYFCQQDGPLRQRPTCVSLTSPPFHPATPLAISVSALLNPTLPLPLLRLNKLIHSEAAETLYGSNRFKFVLGPTARVRQMWHRRYPGNREPVCCDARCRIHYTYASDGTHYTYEDNLFSLPSRYLKLIKRCDIHVQMPAVPSRREAQFYSNIRTRLGDFAARFGGLDHSLQEVVVQFNQPRTDVVPAQADVKVQEAWARQVESLWREGVSIDRGCLTQRSTFVCALNGRAENALEPLGTVYGARTVKVVGASKEMKAKLEKAMTSRNLACVSKEEKYGTRRARIIKRRRKKESQRYRLGKFYETKFDWAV